MSTLTLPRNQAETAALSAAELEQLFWQGVTPKAEDLIGWEFKGYNHPWFLEFAGIRKFCKGFFKGEGDDTWFEGFNYDVLQNGLYAKWLPKQGEDNIKRYGFYQVYKVRADEPDNLYPHAMLLNYGANRRNPTVDVTKVLRDYLVQVSPDNPDLYLGKAYLSFGLLRPAVSFFILERNRQHSWNG